MTCPVGPDPRRDRRNDQQRDGQDQPLATLRAAITTKAESHDYRAAMPGSPALRVISVALWPSCRNSPSTSICFARSAFGVDPRGGQVTATGGLQVGFGKNRNDGTGGDDLQVDQHGDDALGSRLNQVHQRMPAAMAPADAKLTASLS